MTTITTLLSDFVNDLPTPTARIDALDSCQRYVNVWQALLNIEFPAANYRDALLEAFAFEALPGFEARAHETDGAK